MEEAKRRAFLKEIYPSALEIENKHGIPAVAICAQACLESAWGEKRIGNNIFGIKAKRSDIKKIRTLTTEYTTNPSEYHDDDVVSITPVNGRYKLKVWQYFADYESIEACLMAHSALLLTDRYKHCLRWNYSPKRFLICVANSGYATAPNYKKLMCDMVDSVTRRLETA